MSNLDLLTTSVWPGVVAWVVLYISDHSLTIVGARLQRQQDKFVVEGSYELTPYHQADIDALRWVSPRFFAALVMGLVWILLTWWLTRDPPAPGFYRLVLGALLLTELTVHPRHLMNWHMFTRVLPTARGKLEYERASVLRASGFELLVWAGIYAVLVGVTGSWFILGGTIGCFGYGLNHYVLASRHEATARARTALK